MSDAAVRHVLGPSPLTTATATAARSRHVTPPPPPPPPPPSSTNPGPTIVWFRGHDLRVHDHPALDAAVASPRPVVALYILERGAETDGVSTYIRPPLSPTVTSSSRPTPPAPAQSPPTPLSPNGSFTLGRVQRWYLHHSLCVLREQLANLGITLVLRRVDCADDTAVELSHIATALRAAAVFWNKRYKPRAYPVDDAVHQLLGAKHLVVSEFDSETLMPHSGPAHPHYDDFQSYTRFWMDTMRAHPPPRPQPPLTPDTVHALSRHHVETALAPASLPAACSPTPNGYWPIAKPLLDIVDLELLDGLNVYAPHSPGDVATIGCKAAERTLAAFLEEDRFQTFACSTARRDGMVTGKHLATSRLSPHVRFGEISPRVLFYAVVDVGARAKLNGNVRGWDAARTFLKNMSLREFGYYMLGRYPSAASKPIMPEFQVFPWVRDDEHVLEHAWKTGTTGFPIVDAAMRQLISEGWIHNRMRFLAASFFCKYLLLPWPVGAAHMVCTLVDGDEACNSLGWQWTAGCNSDSFPFSTHINPLSLYNHTRSRQQAAAYVRKYVPELAGLPDSLLFTPWKATPEQRRLYRFSLVPHDEFRIIKSEWAQAPSSCSSPFGLYPTRIVNASEARKRARDAMEVMRRIFSAQRRVRTIIVDQASPRHGFPGVKVVEQRLLLPASQDAMAVADIENIEEEQMSTVTLTRVPSMEKVHKNSRALEESLETKPLESPLKKQRLPGGNATATKEPVTCSDVTDLMSVSNIGTASSGISKGEVDLLLSSREMNEQGTTRRLRRPASEIAGLSELPYPESRMSKESTNSPNSTAKRPRASQRLHSPLAADERLSVQALLTPTMQDPAAMGVRKTRVPPKLPTWSANADAQPRSDGLQKFDGASVGRQHREQQAQVQFAPGHPGTVQIPSPVSFRSDERKHVRGGHAQHRQELSPPQVHQANAPLNAYVDRRGRQVSRAQSTEFGTAAPMASLRQGSADGLHKPWQTNVGTFRRSDVVSGSHVPGVVSVHPDALKNDRLPHQPAFDSSRVAGNGLYQHGMPQMPVHFQGGAQPHNPQMMVPFRAGGPMAVSQVGHQPGAIHGQDAAQRYFHAMPPMNPQHHGPHSQPVIFYPAVPQYVDMRMDMRVSGMPAVPIPQLMHPMVSSHPGAISIGYPAPGGGTPGATGPSNGRIGHANGNQGQLSDADAGARRGPSNPMEREEIARRMAAMDYYDDAYGGKHWEQWQAIALHLLDQYEFSEDTDRQTSKAYVRLCVLKDELRDANPRGPRVTVNHCKEVFSILRLPVTGEWDRRGHGGVRGPYCYGCVKRSGVQISKK